MIYLREFTIPPKKVDELVFTPSKPKNPYFIPETNIPAYNNHYPFIIFRNRIVKPVEFSNITIFCGDNGSGKSTILNLIAEKLEINRSSAFNRSSFFDDYLKLCSYDMSSNFSSNILSNSKVITSDDVFDFLLNLRYANEGIDVKREELLSEYVESKNKDFKFSSLDDYEEMKKVVDSKRQSASKYVKDRTMKNIIGRSNGESAYMYFTENIRESGIYILDEPENSLSVKNQIKLVKYIEDSARFYNCQFIIATHSPFVLSLKEAKVYDLDSTPMVESKWTEIENVKLYYKFFKDREEEFK
ncbi:Predicted ATPase [Anaerosphaera aminiphila DSM 21120]|uniref:Predicted ATPase n=1 Tax=Anaerosphaera aminiphila DSM 21120 TaxID=1120995 RepID=A0A1M5RVF7_9FIRM|nr:AAA family ATPase [Anaerosphaera aminiphila]SHH30224.1 Predicted ATPase [Anaerosphaera aminiphila DSM 21120]